MWQFRQYVDVDIFFSSAASSTIPTYLLASSPIFQIYSQEKSTTKNKLLLNKVLSFMSLVHTNTYSHATLSVSTRNEARMIVAHRHKRTLFMCFMEKSRRSEEKKVTSKKMSAYFKIRYSHFTWDFISHCAHFNNFSFRMYNGKRFGNLQANLIQKDWYLRPNSLFLSVLSIIP